jgi:hypothetical protein
MQRINEFHLFNQRDQQETSAKAIKKPSHPPETLLISILYHFRITSFPLARSPSSNPECAAFCNSKHYSCHRLTRKIYRQA